jgi:tetratricopeptide (TPR) repeat protein
MAASCLRDAWEGLQGTDLADERGRVEIKLGQVLIEQYEDDHDIAHLSNARTWTDQAVRSFAQAGDSFQHALALDNLAYCALRGGDFAEAERCAALSLQEISAVPGLSRDKAVVHGNLLTALLHQGQSDAAEGHLLESTFHYAMAGDFDGLCRVYIGLFHDRRLLPVQLRRRVGRLYDAAFYTWGYAGSPRLAESIAGINAQYLQWTIEMRNVAAAVRTVDDFGFISRGWPTSWRVALAAKRCARIVSAFPDSGQPALRRRIRSSRWWRPYEARAIEASCR